MLKIMISDVYLLTSCVGLVVDNFMSRVVVALAREKEKKNIHVTS